MCSTSEPVPRSLGTSDRSSTRLPASVIGTTTPLKRCWQARIEAFELDAGVGVSRGVPGGSGGGYRPIRMPHSRRQLLPLGQ